MSIFKRIWRGISRTWDKVDDEVYEFFRDSIPRLARKYGPKGIAIIRQVVDEMQSTGKPGAEKREEAVKTLMRLLRGLVKEAAETEVRALIELAVLRLKP